MRTRVTTFRKVVLGAVLAAAIPAVLVYAQAAGSGPCAPATSNLAALLLAKYRWLMGGDDTTRIAERARDAIPKVDPMMVVMVTDTTVCRMAANAYTAALQDTTSDRSVHVVKIGNRYIVMDPFKWAGKGPAPKVTFDSTFTAKYAQMF